jgi:hypothetical protein
MTDEINNHSAGFHPAEEWEALGPNPSVEARRGFFNKLRGGSYLVPCKKDKPEELSVLNDQKNGRRLLPLFTDEEELEKWPFAEVERVTMEFERLKTLVIDKPGELHGLVINPFGRAMTLLLPQLQEIDSLTKGYSFARSQNRGEVRYFPPFISVPPLNAALKVIFDNFDTVYRAWLLLAQPKDELAPHLAMIIDFTGDQQKLFAQVADLLKPYMKKGDRFDLTKADYKLLRAAEQVCKPVYERE